MINTIILGDSLESLKKLDDNFVDIIITSPPYNKGGGSTKKGTTISSTGRKNHSWVSKIDYDSFEDNLDKDVYQQNQLNILNECFRVLKPSGSIFYNHKNVRKNGSIITPYEWVLKSKLNLYQEIIWNRNSTVDQNIKYFSPITEKIFWLTKTNKPTVCGKRSTKMKNEIWDITPKADKLHPAPFPKELVDNCLDMIGIDSGIVLDPYSGSGTTLTQAKIKGLDYIGLEISKNYKLLSEEKLKKYKHYWR